MNHVIWLRVGSNDLEINIQSHSSPRLGLIFSPPLSLPTQRSTFNVQPQPRSTSTSMIDGVTLVSPPGVFFFYFLILYLFFVLAMTSISTASTTMTTATTTIHHHQHQHHQHFKNPQATQCVETATAAPLTAAPVGA
jgi:hypothetical protein